MLRFDSPAISFDNVTKSFGEEEVLRNLNFSIPQGKITTILGFSGAGKSTLMKHMLGLLFPTKGKVSVLGNDLSYMKEIELRNFRRKFGMVFQYAALFDSLTSFENVKFPLKEFTKESDEAMNQKVDKLLQSVGLEEQAFGKLPSEISGGMRKRVGLARALALNPQIILYDEPTTGLDPITTKMVNNLIRKTATVHQDRQVTSVIISHDMKATFEVSDYIAFLNKGQILEYLPVEEFRNSSHPIVRQFLDI
jgi:phospholipid/cholesterol/gamma-HCH transport system ATP-binding protein